MDILKNVAIRSVAVGSNHVIAVDVDGTCYTWGIGEQGQLGRKIYEVRGKEKQTLEPRKIVLKNARRQVKVGAVYGGAYHTLFVAEDGRTVYSSGLNQYGQLWVSCDSFWSLFCV